MNVSFTYILTVGYSFNSSFSSANVFCVWGGGGGGWRGCWGQGNSFAIPSKVEGGNKES